MLQHIDIQIPTDTLKYQGCLEEPKLAVLAHCALPTPSKTDLRFYHSTLSTRSYLAFALPVALALQLLLGGK